MLNSSDIRDILIPEFGELSLSKLTGDASTREYYRGENGKYDLAIQVYSDQDEVFNAQCHSYAFLSKHEIPVSPIIKAYDEEKVIIFKYLSGGTLFERFAAGETLSRYRKGLEDLLNRLALLPHKEYSSRYSPLNREKYIWGFNFFKKEFLQKELHITLDSGLERALLLEFEDIAAVLDRGSTSLIHRDFHSRNIMIHEDELFLIDYQDLREGNAFYDRASLLWDVYFDHGDERAKMFPGINRYYYQLQFSAIQRLFKILGNFAYLKNTYSKNDYLAENTARILIFLDDLLSTTGYVEMKRILRIIKDR
ncbi:aminoglycoside phosphotransferase family protein [bacterium]|nr:aminoglycoside phosphotransferase family protein [bacterium]